MSLRPRGEFDQEPVGIYSESEGNAHKKPKFGDGIASKLIAQPVADNRQSGIIKSLELINFMCHEHLTVNFGPLVNFVIGQNGSKTF